MSRLTRFIGEQWNWPVAYRPWFLRNWSALRGALNEGLLGRPVMQQTRVNYDLARSLYRNDNEDYNLGAGFVKPIIDLMVEYIGIPYVTSDSGQRDTFLNECIHDYWAPQLAEAYRCAMRDSKVIVRFRQPRLDNPLFTEQDRMHGRIETLPPEQATITYDPSDGDLIEQAIFTHYIEFDERTLDEVMRGEAPRMKEHEVHEVITQSEYRFYDKTDDRELQSWRTANTWNFVPAWEIWNEWDSSLGGGQSDIEPILAFVKAFHDVMYQALTAHKYHSSPKAKLKLKDVYTFLQNNYPDVLDETTGKIKQGASIKWSGREVFLMNSEEDFEFINLTSVLGDSKTLLDFLIDCIAIASETPKWALLKSEAPGTDASVTPFEKKVARKRTQFDILIVMLCKMAQAAKGQPPVTVRVTWPTIRVADLASRGQAIQQIIMAFDVAAQHEWVADQTVVQILSTLFPEISAPEIEMQLAKNNIVPVVAAPAPASGTQGAQTGVASNGGGSKSAAKKALATTQPSKS